MEEVWRQGDKESRSGDKETRSQGLETRRQGVKVWRQGDKVNGGGHSGEVREVAGWRPCVDRTPILFHHRQ